MSKYLNKYRNESFRAQWWDYSNEGSYFITICTANRELILGDIYNKEMHLSPIGEIVFEEWNKSFEIRAELFCDIFVIMPNHIHAILRIEKSCRDGQPSIHTRRPSIPTSIQIGYLHQFDYKINDETGIDFLQIGYFIEL